MRENAFRKANPGPEYQVVRHDSMTQAARDFTAEIIAEQRVQQESIIETNDDQWHGTFVDSRIDIVTTEEQEKIVNVDP
jgi:hypothetical protein